MLKLVTEGVHEGGDCGDSIRQSICAFGRGGKRNAGLATTHLVLLPF